MEKMLPIPLALIVFYLLPFSTPLPSQAILDAAQVLSNSGSVSMALTLELVADALASQSPSITVFSPSDAAFTDSGQPSLSLLQLHFSPLALSFESLRSLPYGTRIPTMSSGKSLTVTSPDQYTPFSLNNVTVIGSPIYNDGSLIVFEIDKFFDPNFEISSPIRSPSLYLQCFVSLAWANSSSLYNSSSFNEASEILRSRGYSVVASFLLLQLLGFHDWPKLTVFAPIDDVIVHTLGNFNDYPSTLLRHIVPCAIKFADLTNLEEGTELSTYDNFTIKVTRSNDLVLLNEIPVTFPDMYFSDWLVVHGLHEVLEPAEMPQAAAAEGAEPSLPQFRRRLEVVPAHRTEF